MTRLYILEGPDGGGKSRLAEALAEKYRAEYVYHGAYEGKKRIADIYLSSILPAILGEETIVLDRSWLSEPIYARVYHDGHDRVGIVNQRILERAAMRAGAVVIKCQPDYKTCLESWTQRHAKGGSTSPPLAS